MLRLLTPIYYNLHGLNKTKSTSHTYIQHKALISAWACRLEMKDCVQTAIKYFNTWESLPYPNESNFIPVDLRMTVYCTAIRHGNHSAWNFLWQRYLETIVAAEKQAIIYALSCTKNSTILKTYLNLVFDPIDGMSMEESRHAFNSLARSMYGYRIALNYFLNNIDHLNDL